MFKVEIKYQNIDGMFKQINRVSILDYPISI